MTLLTKEEMEKFGLVYEPDRSKCKSRKLRHYIPKIVDDMFKEEIIKEIKESGWKYIHKVIESPNPYESDPNFIADPKPIIVGHS